MIVNYILAFLLIVGMVGTGSTFGTDRFKALDRLDLGNLLRGLVNSLSAAQSVV